MQVDPSANAGYVIVAYAAAAVYLGGYALMLWLRARKVTRR